MSISDTSEARSSLIADLASQLAFQKRWRVLSMSAYVITTVGTLLCSAGATYFAASGASSIAAVLAAVATVLVGTEKSLLFREKWKFHLLMYTKLNVFRTKVLLGRIAQEQAFDEYGTLLMMYASELPMAAREQT
ncbi:hypothetical protein HZZ13_33970 [Bradyrhizobium sp. CNPSo 4010]|uniref:DUF4231 domain-containing protein n=1 Tax=Bradyrhizobium agreste TaxID=2751811 RepID=A0ABS0Q0X9_9BRAD|nr:hypothetical protein [Bradyrhizobium agreste]MBH5402767.1 hypothetical protein [Bradyrhizobium agreste]